VKFLFFFWHATRKRAPKPLACVAVASCTLLLLLLLLLRLMLLLRRVVAAAAAAAAQRSLTRRAPHFALKLNARRLAE